MREQIPNPFDADVVAFPGQPVPADVREIHDYAFRRCREEYVKVSAGQSRSLLLHGKAGCGKTHLLGRFRRWLAGEIDGGPEVAPAVFVPVRMETAPGQVWRHLQRRFAEQLLERSAAGVAPLDGILKRFAERRGAGGLSRAFDAAGIPDLTHELIRVLEHYHAGRQRRLCRAWLKGDLLTDRDLETLEVPGGIEDETDEEMGETGARRFTLAMVSLCAPEPVVFCFDQIEALRISTAANCYGPFSKMVASLTDCTSNSLVISSILSSYIPEFEEQSMRSDLDRVGRLVQDLQPLDPLLGAKLLAARLDGIPQLNPYRPRGGIEPLREVDIDALFAADRGFCTARKLIHEARRLFDVWRGCSAAPAEPVESFLASRFSRYREDSPVRSDPTRSDAILAHGLAQFICYPKKTNPSRDIDFEVDAPAGKVLICLCGKQNTRSLAAQFRRMAANLDGAAQARLRLVRDPRLVIKPAAQATRTRLEALQSAGARLVHPRPEALAALDAMRRLLAEATSGDLTHQGESVAEQTVAGWLAANLPPEVSALLDELTGQSEGGPLPPPPDGTLLELLREAKVLDAAEAARRLGWTMEQIENHARQNPDSIGFVAGSPAVVFDLGFATAVGSDRHA